MTRPSLQTILNITGSAIFTGIVAGGIVHAIHNLDHNSASALADSTAYHRSIDSIANATANSVGSTPTSKTYVANSADLAKMVDSTKLKSQLDTNKVVKKVPQVPKPVPIMYNGVEVDSLREFSNAKLIGVDNNNIEFYHGNNLHTYFAKGLLFELNNTKLLTLIARDESYYLGQRYNLEYYHFKKGVEISGTTLLKMFLSGKCEAYLANAHYNEMYDGVLKDARLSKKK